MSKNYLHYLIKSKKVGWIFFAVMAVVIAQTPFLFNRGYDYGSLVDTTSIAFGIGIAFTYVLPLLCLHFVHRKRSVDLFYALPVSRKQMLITTYVFMFAFTFGLFTISLLLGVIFETLFTPSTIIFSNIVRLWLHSGLTFLVLLLMNGALFLIANNILDGIIMIGAYNFIPVILYVLISVMGANLVAGSEGFRDVYESIMFYASPVAMGVANFASKLNTIVQDQYFYGGLDEFNYLYEVLLVVFGVVSTYLVYTHFVKRKVERAEQISDEFLAYPFVIHFYLTSLLAVLATYTIKERSVLIAIMYLLLLFVFVVAMFVYRRTLHITLRILLRYAAIAVATIIFALGGWYTKGFGLANRPVNISEKYIVYNYGASVYTNDLVKVYFYDDEDYLDISVDVAIEQSKKDNNEAYQILENKRKEYIDIFYENNEYNYGTYMTIYGSDTLQNLTSNRSYRGNVTFTMEELQTLSEYGDVTIWVSYHDDEGNWDSKTYSLDECLEEYGK